jgi:hypothetical protein
MSKVKKPRIRWDEKSLEIERLDCKNNQAAFELLVGYVTRELTDQVISERELNDITSPEEIQFFVREAVTKYDVGRHANLAWYSFQRLKFLVGKWKRQSEGHGIGQGKK